METTATHPNGPRLVVSPTPGHDGLLVRARTRLLRSRLDSLIARAVERPGDRALVRREAQLADKRVRRRLADRVGEVLELAARPRPARSAAVPIDREAVDIARPALTELALALRSDEVVEPRGVAMTLCLLTDACSPVYLPPSGRSADPEALSWAARRALEALRPLGAGTVAVGLR
jgi:hypothetical protein